MLTKANLKINRHRRSQKLRSGVATVELAVCLPVLLILVFGTIEICQRIFLRQSAVIVAYEGARLAARGSSTNEQVVARCVDLLTSRRVQFGAIQVTPENFLTAATGSEITVRITVPWAENSPTRIVTKDQGTLVVESTMLRE